MTTVHPGLLSEIKKYSTNDFNVDACFNCGNCTAVCPLSDEKFQFPRALIRYSQVGMKEKVLCNNLMWLCAYCNDCSDTCPRGAEPGEFVMATRRWAMGQYEVTGITRLFHSTKIVGYLAMGIIFLLSLFLFLLFSNPSNITNSRPIRLFDVVPKVIVELVGISIAAILLLIIGLSILNMYRIIAKEYDSNLIQGVSLAYESRKEDKKLNTPYHLLFSPIIMIKQALVVITKEVFGQYRQLECAMPPHLAHSRFRYIKTRWIPHLFILWGFFGLGAATLLNMFFKPDSNALVSIFHPVRILGIVSGILLMIGVSVMGYNRYKKTSRYTTHSLTCDWVFLLHLFLVGLTGFLITITYYIPQIPPVLAYWFFAIHMIVVIELIILAPFGKLAHVWYRSFALWIHYGLHARERKLLKDLKKAKAKQKAKESKTAS
ncbi:MAG: 4Fe-4S dicluster domain-containing protein [Candidatus Hodarchaeales archaeon]